jgi:hypothetical protein
MIYLLFHLRYSSTTYCVLYSSRPVKKEMLGKQRNDPVAFMSALLVSPKFPFPMDTGREQLAPSFNQCRFCCCSPAEFCSWFWIQSLVLSGVLDRQSKARGWHGGIAQQYNNVTRSMSIRVLLVNDSVNEITNTVFSSTTIVLFSFNH